MNLHGTEPEHHIQKGLNHILKDRTCFVIAHRLFTIENAGRILVVHEGRIVEEGDHASLMVLGGRYSRLHAHQSLTASNEGW